MSVFVIAEAGSTWRYGSDHLHSAERLIKFAAQCGANAVKFQWTSNAHLMVIRRNASELTDMYQRYLQYPYEWLPVLKQMCDVVGIEFMVTGYIPEDIAYLNPLLRRAKISSFEASDSSFVGQWLATQKQVILSTGLLTHEELWSLSAHRPRNLMLLHCVSAYPCPAEDMNLKCLALYRLDGLSDHSTSVLPGALAVILGARVIEKHCRLDDTPAENPDYGHSLRSTELREYIRNIREAEKLLPHDTVGRPIRGTFRYKVWCSTCGRQTHSPRQSRCRDCKRLYLSGYYQKNRVRALVYAREAGQKKKAECLSAYSAGEIKCVCCGEKELAFLTLDHEKNDGQWRKRNEPTGYGFYARLRKQGYPQNLGLRVMCFNCNCGRRVNGGMCPHGIL